MQRPLIAIVDDDCALRELFELVLPEEGYDVICHGNGAEALGQLEQQNRLPDLVIVDLMMPVMDGWRLIAEMQKDSTLRHVPTLVLTAAGAHWGYPVPQDRVLHKPFDVDVFLARVRDLVGYADRAATG